VPTILRRAVAFGIGGKLDGKVISLHVNAGDMGVEINSWHFHEQQPLGCQWGANAPSFDAATNKKARYDDRASVCGCPPRNAPRQYGNDPPDYVKGLGE
jgi:hypothetical protein